MTPTFIGIDMDGVVADFNKGVENLVLAPGLASTLDAARLMTPPPSPHPLTREHWNEILNTYESFWSALPPMTMRFEHLLTARELFDAMAGIVGKDNVAFVTAVGGPTARWAAQGKIAWLRAAMGDKGFENFVVTKAEHKRLLAHPSAVLIDDHPRNCQQWRDAGGVDILFNPVELNTLGSKSEVIDNIAQRIRAA